VISKGFFPWKHKGCFWKENLINTLCVYFMFPIDRFFCFSQDLSMGNMLSLFETKKETLIMFQKDKFWEKQKIYLLETWKKHIMCFSDFSFRNTFCVSVGKTLWKSQNVSRNGFFWGKHHPAPAVLIVCSTMLILLFWSRRGSQWKTPVFQQCHLLGMSAVWSSRICDQYQLYVEPCF